MHTHITVDLAIWMTKPTETHSDKSFITKLILLRIHFLSLTGCAHYTKSRYCENKAKKKKSIS